MRVRNILQSLYYGAFMAIEFDSDRKAEIEKLAFDVNQLIPKLQDLYKRAVELNVSLRIVCGNSAFAKGVTATVTDTTNFLEYIQQ